MAANAVNSGAAVYPGLYPGKEWRTRNGVVIPTNLLQTSATRTPNMGDICQLDSSGDPQAVIAPGSNTGTNNITIFGICVSNAQRKLNNPGFNPGFLGGSVAGVVIVAGGSGNTVGDALTFSAPQLAGGITATAVVATVSSGAITGITLTNPGSGYTSAPTITPVGTATLTAVVSGDTTVENIQQASFGGVGSRARSTAPLRQRNIARVTAMDSWLMEPYASTLSASDAGVIGNIYGLRRSSTGVWFLDLTSVPSSGLGLRIIGFDSVTTQTNPSTTRLVWVQPTSVY